MSVFRGGRAEEGDVGGEAVRRWCGEEEVLCSVLEGCLDGMEGDGREGGCVVARYRGSKGLVLTPSHG